jgi:RNA polymerase sigma-70 factor (ECF subfamily)
VEAIFISRLQAGDEDAVDQLVRTHSGWMLSVAQRYVGDGTLAEDCVQDAFLSALRNIGGFEGRSRLKSWLHRIVMNAALTRVRSRRRRNELPIDDLLPRFDEHDCRIEAPWAAIATPDDILASRQKRDLVLACIQRLPENYRIVLLLRDIEELSTNEAAALLNTTAGAVKVRLHRARAALKQLLEPVLKGGL